MSAYVQIPLAPWGEETTEERKRRRARVRIAQIARWVQLLLPFPSAGDWAAERPRTRAECLGRPRPCPWVGCRYHLGLSVMEGGTIETHLLRDGRLGRHTWSPKFLRRAGPDWSEEVAQAVTTMPVSCLLDVVDANGGDRMSLEEIAELQGLVRERVRQIEQAALVQIRTSYRRQQFEDAPEAGPSPWDLMPESIK